MVSRRDWPSLEAFGTLDIGVSEDNVGFLTLGSLK